MLIPSIRMSTATSGSVRNALKTGPQNAAQQSDHPKPQGKGAPQLTGRKAQGAVNAQIFLLGPQEFSRCQQCD